MWEAARDRVQPGSVLDGVSAPPGAALAFDWGQLPENIEVYGVEQRLMGFYPAGMDRAGIAGRIAERAEQAVNAALSLPPDAPDDVLPAAEEDCRRRKNGEKP